MIDLLVRGGTVVTRDGRMPADIAIENGAIAAVGHDLGNARELIDATGLFVLPGLIDVHVHFNEPGREQWEGAASGSRALAAGGGTLFFDMPLNSTPCTIGPDDFARKRAALEAASVTDFGIWGGLVPGRVESMPAMADRGVVGFKAFMCDSGLPEFPRADDRTLLEGLTCAARLGLPVAVHAENEEIVSATKALPADVSARRWASARPVLAELEAVQRALLFAEETRAQLHFVHLSSGRAVSFAAAAKARGVDVSIETCPHYLYFTEEDLDVLGTLGKCAPPLRSPQVQEQLWAELLAGHVEIVASDHSPTEPALKDTSFAAAWGGIAGVQSTLGVLMGREDVARIGLERIVQLTSANPARRFGISSKGVITAGADADLLLLDAAAVTTLKTSDLQQRHKQSPYVDRTFRGVVRQTIRRGEVIWRDGQIIASGGGRLVTPKRS